MKDPELLRQEMLTWFDETKYYPTVVEFIDNWLIQMAGSVGRGGWYKGSYRLRDVRPVCEELIRLQDEIGKEVAA